MEAVTRRGSRAALCYRRRMWIRVLWASFALVALSCGEGTPAPDAGSDGGGVDAARVDSGPTVDAGGRDGGAGRAGSDAGGGDAGTGALLGAGV